MHISRHNPNENDEMFSFNNFSFIYLIFNLIFLCFKHTEWAQNYV